MARGLPCSKKVGSRTLGGPRTLEGSGARMCRGQIQPRLIPSGLGRQLINAPGDCRPSLGFQKGATLAFIRTLIGILIASSLSVFCFA